MKTLYSFVRQNLERAPVPIFIFNKKGGCKYMNGKAIELLDATVPLQKKPGLGNLVIACEHDKIRTIMSELNKRQSVQSTVLINSIRSTIKPARLYGMKILQNSYLILLEQIPESTNDLQTAIQTLYDMNCSKDKFLSILSHDMKNSFTNLLGFIQLLQMEHTNYTDEKRADTIKHIYNSARHLYALLSNLLTWSRLRNGKMQPNIQSFHIIPGLKDSVALYENLAKNKKICINLSSDTDIKVKADPKMTDTILRNLMSNAIKFTPNNGKIDVSCSYAEGRNILISIKDSGVGIPDDKQKIIFDAGSKKSTLGTNNEEGTGLGLVLCKEFVEKNNGSIWVESNEGSGSTFFVRLPAG